jgi:RNA polymerase sigma-70 factor (ECF subfamily)
MHRRHPSRPEPDPSPFQTGPEDSASVRPDDPELFIRRAFDQDPQLGCELLFRRYYANLCSHAVRLVLSKPVAEDLVSDVFLTFWKARTHERITACYGAYLYRAVRNRALNHLRYELHQTRPLEPDEADFAQPETPESLLHVHELTQRLDAEIAALPPQSRRAFLLHRYEGKRYADIAAELGISVKAVEHLVSRVLARLRTGLGGEWLGVLLLLFPCELS